MASRIVENCIFVVDLKNKGGHPRVRYGTGKAGRYSLGCGWIRSR